MIFYRFFAKPLAKFLCWKFAAICEGRENIPNKGPVIFVGKHQRDYDGVLIIGFIPRDLRTIVKDDISSIWLFNWVAKFLLSTLAGMFFIKRNKRDLKAFRQARKVLQEGGALCIFPEGHRGKKLIGFQPGVSSLARAFDDVPIVPFAITNCENLGVLKVIFHVLTFTTPKKRPAIRFGPPIFLPATNGHKKWQSREDANFLRNKVAELLPEELIGENVLYKVPIRD